MWPNFRTMVAAVSPLNRVPLTTLASLLVFLSGCTVGPNYHRPSTEVPAAYKETSPWKVAQPKDEIPRGAWWEIYHDPTLDALEAQVNINNQNVAAAEANFRQALSLIQVARAAYFPTVTGGPSWTRFKRSENLGAATRGVTSGGASGTAGTSGVGGGFGGTGTTGSTLSDYLQTFNAIWEPDIWGKVRRSVESSKATAQASAATLEGVRLSAQATLAQSYFQLRTLDVQRRLYEETIAAYQLVYNVTNNRYTQGVASRADVLQAETQLQSTKAQAIDLGVQRSQLEHAIAVLLGKPPSTFAIPPAPVAMQLPVVPVGVPSELLERRPDIAAAERNMAAANAQVGVTLAAFYPNVTLSAAGGFEAATAPLWFTWPSRFWSLGSAATQTLFAGGLLIGQTEAAREAYESTVATYRQTVLTGFQEVEDNLSALRILAREAQVQNDAVQAARQSVKVSTNQYKAGIISHLDLMVVETQALVNERAAITILGNRMNASVLLVKALGGGWRTKDLPPVTRLSPAPANQSNLPRQNPAQGAVALNQKTEGAGKD